MNKNKKSILKKAIGKYKGKGGPCLSVADKIRSMREGDDSHMRIGSGSTKSPSPFGMIGGAIKGFIKNRAQIQDNFNNRPNNKKYYGSNKDFANK